MASASNIRSSGGKSGQGDPPGRLAAALERAERAFARLAAQRENAAESNAQIAQLLRDHAGLEALYADLQKRHAALAADYEKLAARSIEHGVGDDEEGVRAAYDALREEYEAAVEELDALKSGAAEQTLADDAARLVRELAAARTAHAELERAYAKLRDGELIRAGDAEGEARRAEAAALDAALAAKRAELKRLDAIHAEVAGRLDGVIDELAQLMAGE